MSLVKLVTGDTVAIDSPLLSRPLTAVNLAQVNAAVGCLARIPLPQGVLRPPGAKRTASFGLGSGRETPTRTRSAGDQLEQGRWST